MTAWTFGVTVKPYYCQCTLDVAMYAAHIAADDNQDVGVCEYAGDI